jgi:3-oxoacyl-[acyl-carrier protein] reductase
VSDLFLTLGSHPQARQVIKTLGLPIPLPQPLRRSEGPWEERPLADRTIVASGIADAALADAVARALVIAGGNPHTIVEPAPAFRALGEAYGRPAKTLSLAEIPAGFRADALVFDATGIETAAGLRALYDFFAPLAPTLATSGRVIVLGRPAGLAATPEAAAAAAGLEGFVRSLAKEIGKRGATAQLFIVQPGAEPRVEPALRFFLSPRSAFVTGQPIVIDAGVKGEVPTGYVRPLDGKVALVTGAARGIGQATAVRLAQEGAHVVCLDRPADDGPLSQVARQVSGSILLADVTDEAAPATIAEHLLTRHGGVDVVVHNAGITRDKTLARMKPEQWDAVLDINLAAITRIDAALHAGVLRANGREICLASVAGIAGNLGQTNYAASKAAVIAYVARIAQMLAPLGVTVNAVAPGFIETRLTAAIPLVIREAGRRLSALGQGGLPKDVAEVITFLASPGAVGVSGRTLRVCGGAFLGA